MSEQERANRLAQDIERLMAGEPVSGDDALFALAKVLGNGPVQPRPQASAQFERQLNQWFGAPPRPLPRHAPAPVLTAAISLALLAVLITGLLVVGPLVAPRPTSTPTPAPTDTPTHASPTPTRTGTPTNTPTPEPTETPTPLTYSRVIVSGRIDSIQGNIIVVLGQSIRIEGSMSRLCVGDLIRVDVSIGPDGAYTATRDALTVETSACPPAPIAPTAPPASGGDQHDHHHDD